MPDRHITSLLPPPVEARTSGDDLSIGLPEGGSEQFSLLYIPSLTLRSVNEVLREEEASRPRRVFVSYQRSSRDAREALRAAGIAFAGADGRLFVRAPGILIEREEPRRLKEDWELEVPSVVPLRNPFSKRSSRVPRWLLLHHAKTFFLSELADAVNLNPATTSRVVRALEDADSSASQNPAPMGVESMFGSTAHASYSTLGFPIGKNVRFVSDGGMSGRVTQTMRFALSRWP